MKAWSQYLCRSIEHFDVVIGTPPQSAPRSLFLPCGRGVQRCDAVNEIKNNKHAAKSFELFSQNGHAMCACVCSFLVSRVWACLCSFWRPAVLRDMHSQNGCVSSDGLRITPPPVGRKLAWRSHSTTAKCPQLNRVNVLVCLWVFLCLSHDARYHVEKKKRNPSTPPPPIPSVMKHSIMKKADKTRRIVTELPSCGPTHAESHTNHVEIVSNLNQISSA